MASLVRCISQRTVGAGDVPKTKVELLDRFDALVQTVVCVLKEGESTYELDGTEMYLLMDGYKSMRDELDLLRSRTDSVKNLLLQAESILAR